VWHVSARGYDREVIADRTETAFYYPGVIWHNAGWVKSLALFFDEIALLVPDYMRDRPLALDPAIAEPLQDAGLLRVLSPEALVGQDASEELATAMVEILASGVLDDLPREGRFEELSWSRMGGLGDPELARMVFEELEQRGLAKPSEDGASIPMHRMVRSLYLVLLAQILRKAGPGIGLELSPATDRPQVQEALVELLRVPGPQAGAGSVVTVDLEVVGPDLESVPLDEVLAFRMEHGHEYQAYARRLREIVHTLAATPVDDHEQLLADRRDEIREAADTLRRGPLKLLASVGGIGLGIAGGIATAVTGDVLPGVLGAGSAASGIATMPQRATTPYSYLFAMRRQFA
jgi:hypothetical protein